MPRTVISATRPTVPNRRGSLRTRILIWLLPLCVVVVGGLIVIAGRQMRAAELKSTRDTAQRLAQAQANEFNAFSSGYEGRANAVATMAAGYSGGNPAQAAAMLRRTLQDERNPAIAGLGTYYEPRAFSHADEQRPRGSQDKTGHMTGYNQQGRFAPYWDRYTNKDKRALRGSAG